jgi:hypothetical protein
MTPAMVLIMGIDSQIRGSESLLIHGLADAVAHLMTTLICLAALRTVGIPVHWFAGLVGAVVLDLDHLPLLLHLVEPVAGSSRPGTHSLAAVAPILFIGLIVSPWRFVLWSLGLGILTHLVRDAATGFVPLGWPLSNQPVHLRYSIYLLLLVTLATVTTVVAVIRSQQPHRE